MTRKSPQAETLAALAAHHDQIVGRSLARVEKAALAYMLAETLAYSAAHPRRRVVLCSAMGTTSLHVEKGPGRGEYLICTADHGDRVHVPPFLAEIDRVLEITDQDYFGPIRITCKGGKLVESVTDW